jgi:dihydroflavonol-4-reductase
MARVAITGASGLLGGNLAMRLAALGHNVHALRRTARSTAHLPSFPVQWHDGDLNDMGSLQRCFAGADVVFHCAAAVSIANHVTKTLHDTNVVGTRNVVASIPPGTRLVHTSSTVCIGLAPRADSPADETASWNFEEAGLADGYAQTKKTAEDELRAHVHSHSQFDAVVVNPGYLIGAHDEKPSSGKLVLDAALGKIPFYTLGRNSFTPVVDVVEGMIAAWQRGARGERYILGGHNLTYRDFLMRVSSHVQRTPARFAAPPMMTSMAAVALEAFTRLQRSETEPLLTRSAARWSHCDRFVVSSAKAQQHLGYTISSIDDAIAAAVQHWRHRGRLS